MMITCEARNEDSSEEKFVAHRNTKWLVAMEKEEANIYRLEKVVWNRGESRDEEEVAAHMMVPLTW